MAKELSLKNIRQEFKDKGVFHTTEKLAKYMREHLPNDVEEIYDPTVGYGNLLKPFAKSVKKYGQDIDATSIEVCNETLDNFTGVVGDLLTEPAFMDRKFKYIIANPPFSVKWEAKEDERFPILAPNNRADLAFLQHIVYMLEDTAVVLMFPGVLYRANKERAIRKWLVEQNLIESIENIQGGEFVDTNIAVVLLVIKKNRTKNTILIKNDGLEREVTFDEIAENNFNLSPSTYVVREVEKEIIDPYKLEQDIRTEIKSRLKAQLNISAMIYKTFGDIPPVTEFVSDIRKILDEFEEEQNDERLNNSRFDNCFNINNVW